MNELLGEQHTSGLGDCYGGDSEVLFEQAAKLSTAHAKPSRQHLDVRIVTVKCAFGNQSKAS
jgi:hypothetical protein